MELNLVGRPRIVSGYLHRLTGLDSFCSCQCGEFIIHEVVVGTGEDISGVSEGDNFFRSLESIGSRRVKMKIEHMKRGKEVIGKKDFLQTPFCSYYSEEEHFHKLMIVNCNKNILHSNNSVYFTRKISTLSSVTLMFLL